MRPLHRKFSAEARQVLRKLPPQIKPLIRALADQILQDPSLGKPLRDELAGYYSVKHSHYRLIYSIDQSKKQLIIEFAGLRKDVYALFSEIIKKPLS